MDLVIVIVLLLIVVLWFKSFNSFVYFLALIDIFLRIYTFIRLNIGIPEISNFLARLNIPASIPAILGAYSNGIFYTILICGYIIIYIIFEWYIIKTFFHKK